MHSSSHSSAATKRSDHNSSTWQQLESNSSRSDNYSPDSNHVIEIGEEDEGSPLDFTESLLSEKGVSRQSKSSRISPSLAYRYVGTGLQQRKVLHSVNNSNNDNNNNINNGEDDASENISLVTMSSTSAERPPDGSSLAVTAGLDDNISTQEKTRRDRRTGQGLWGRLLAYSRKALPAPRTFGLNDNLDGRMRKQAARDFPPNVVRNQKYSILSFIPKVLYNQVSLSENQHLSLTILSSFSFAVQIFLQLLLFGHLHFAVVSQPSRQLLVHQPFSAHFRAHRYHA